MCQLWDSDIDFGKFLTGFVLSSNHADGTIEVILADFNNKVERQSLEMNDSRIAGYAMLTNKDRFENQDLFVQDAGAVMDNDEETVESAASQKVSIDIEAADIEEAFSDSDTDIQAEIEVSDPENSDIASDSNSPTIVDEIESTVIHAEEVVLDLITKVLADPIEYDPSEDPYHKEESEETDADENETDKSEVGEDESEETEMDENESEKSDVHEDKSEVSDTDEDESGKAEADEDQVLNETETENGAAESEKTEDAGSLYDQSDQDKTDSDKPSENQSSENTDQNSSDNNTVSGNTENADMDPVQVDSDLLEETQNRLDLLFNIKDIYDVETQELNLDSKAEEREFIINSISLEVSKNGKDGFVDISSVKEITLDDWLKFNIQYEIPGYSLSPEKPYVEYQLPKEFLIQKEESKQMVHDGKVIGSYVIRSDGKVVINFCEEYVAQNQEGFRIIGKVGFISKVEHIKHENNDIIELPFEDFDKVIIHVGKQEELKIEKSQSWHGKAGTYTIKLSSSTGTSNPVELKDMMEKVSLTQDQLNKIQISSNKNSDLNQIKKEWKSDSEFLLTFPPLKEGEVYEISYEVEADSSVFFAKNTASASTVPQYGNKIETNPVTVTQDFIQDPIEKKKEELPDGKVKWTVIVNKENQIADLGGWKIEDHMNGTELRNVNITLSKYDANSNSAVSGTGQSISLPYIFPKESTGAYILEYTTGNDLPVGGQQYHNQAFLIYTDDSWHEKWYPSKWVGGGWQNNAYNPLTKTALRYEHNNAEDLSTRIFWKLSVNADKGTIPAVWTLNDNLQNNQYFTGKQAEIFENNLKNALSKVNPKLIYEVRFSKLNDLSSTSQISLSDIKNMSDEQKNQLKLSKASVYFKSDLPKGARFEFEYESTAPSKYIDVPTHMENKADINEKAEAKAEILIHPTSLKLQKADALAGHTASQTVHIINRNQDIDLESKDKRPVDLSWQVSAFIPENYYKWSQDENKTDYYNPSGLIVQEHFPAGILVNSVEVYGRTDASNTQGFSQIVGWYGEFKDTTSGKEYIPATGFPVIKTDEKYGDQPYLQMIPGVYPEAGDSDSEVSKNGGSAVWFKFSGEWLKQNNFVEIRLIFKAEVAADAPWDEQNNFDLELTLKNNAVLYKENEGKIDEREQTQIIKDLAKPVIDKNLLNRNEANKSPYVLNYEVLFNPEGRTLLSKNATLQLEDTLNYYYDTTIPVSVALLEDTVKIYLLNPDGSIKKDENGEDQVLDLEEYPFTLEDAPIEDYQNAWQNRKKILKFNVPDHTPLKIVYSYKFYGLNAGIDITNKIKVLGIDRDLSDSSDKVWIQVQNSYGDASIDGVMLEKTDSLNTHHKLKGAKFDLYIKNDSGNFEKVENRELISNEQGKINLGSLISKKEYMLKETEAPEGYLVETHSIYFMYFSPDDLASGNAKIPVGYEGHILLPGTTLNVPNRRAVTRITIKKNWQNAARVSSDGPVTEDVEKIQVQVLSKGTVKGAPKLNVVFSRNADYVSPGTIWKKKVFTQSVPAGMRSYSFAFSLMGKKDWQPTLKYKLPSDTEWREAPKILDYDEAGQSESEFKVFYEIQVDSIEHDIQIELQSDQIHELKDEGVYYTNPAPKGAESKWLANEWRQYEVTPDENGEWSLEIDDLPSIELYNNRYVEMSYMVKELPVEDYVTGGYVNNEGITGGEISILNYYSPKPPAFELPETGGSGVDLLYGAGSALSIASLGYGWYYSRKSKVKKDSK